MENVVHHAASVADFQTAGLDAADRGRADDGHALGGGQLVQLAGHVLGDALGDDGDGAELRVVHRLDGALVRRTERGKVHHDVGGRVLLHGVVHRLVDRDEDLAVAPVELLLVIARERVDHGDHRRLFAAADEVEVEHGLNRARLHAPHDRLRFRREKWLQMSQTGAGSVDRGTAGVRLVRPVSNARVGGNSPTSGHLSKQ